MNRKSRLEARNLGATHGATIEDYFDGPDLAQARVNVVMVERVLLAVLRTEFARLTASTGGSEAERIFGHIFDPLLGDNERQEIVTYFQRRPPNVVLGYPRTTTEMPCVSITLGEESETDPNALDDYVGETLDGEDGEYAEYRGTMFDQTYNIFCYAEHPDICAFLYHAVKLFLFGAKPFLIQAGLIDPRFSGGDLAPDEGAYVPESIFMRVARLSCKSLNTMPVLRLDPARYRITGVFRDDVVVDGVRGGVSVYTPDGDNSDGST